jgi:hypothetical protein
MAVLQITRKREKELDELAVGHPGCKPSLDRAPVPISVETHAETQSIFEKARHAFGTLMRQRNCSAYAAMQYIS